MRGTWLANNDQNLWSSLVNFSCVSFFSTKIITDGKSWQFANKQEYLFNTYQSFIAYTNGVKPSFSFFFESKI